MYTKYEFGKQLAEKVTNKNDISYSSYKSCFFLKKNSHKLLANGGLNSHHDKSHQTNSIRRSNGR